MTNVVEIPSVPMDDYTEYLTRQGITKEDADELHLSFLMRGDSRKKLGYKLECDSIVIPYPGENFFRVRCIGHIPRGYRGGKYMSPRGSGCAPPFLPPNISLDDWADIKVSTDKPVFISEGEFKAWWGCSAGWPTIGVGGVAMQETLFTTGWEWKGRRVFISFDKDAGYEAGTYKQAVRVQLGKLSAALVQRGAIVKNCVLPGELDQKVGLDDYIRAGGTLERLANTAVDPEKWSADLTFLLENCVQITGTNHTYVYGLHNNTHKLFASFREEHVQRVMYETDSNGKTKVVELTKVWQMHPGRSSAWGITMDPSQGRGVVMDSEGRPQVNIWDPYPVFSERRDAMLADWEKYVKRLFGEEPVKTLGRDGSYTYLPAWEWVCLWVAHGLNRPEELTTQAVMLTTRVMGIGKSVFGDIMRRLYGKHGAEVPAKRLLANFNAESETVVFCQTDELTSSARISESDLNHLITSETITIERKGIDATILPNLRRRYLTTNASAPLQLSRGQRRILVLSPEITTAEAEGEWGEWMNTVVGNWKEDRYALGSIREWLDILWEDKGANWDPKARIFETQASRDVSEASMSVTDIEVEELVVWMAEHGGLGAVKPINKKSRARMFGDLAAKVKSLGGRVGSKVIKEEGKAVAYTVWDVTGNAPWHRSESGNAVFDITADECRGAAADLWLHFTNFVQVQESMLGARR